MSNLSVERRRAALTAREQLWYRLGCLAFGAGYLAKIPVAKTLSELPRPAPAGGGSLVALPLQQPSGPESLEPAELPAVSKAPGEPAAEA